MFALPIAMPRFKSIIFYQNSPKMKLFLQKDAKFLIAGGSAPRPPKQLPHCEFLATRLFCVDADNFAGESLINTIFEVGKTKRAFYVINLNWIG